MNLNRLLNFFVSALTGIVLLAFDVSTATADPIIIRATDALSGGAINAAVTDTTLANTATFSHTVGNFSITLVNTGTTGPGFTSHSQTINVTYNGATGANSDSLIIEVLSRNYINPSAGLAAITSNASLSTSGLLAGSVTMTSCVLTTNPVTLGAAGTTLGGCSGTTSATGTLGSASSVLTPNPVTGQAFNLPGTPYAFYQAYTIGNFTNSGQLGSISAGSTVQPAAAAVPEPSSLLLLGSGLIGLRMILRKRKK